MSAVRDFHLIVVKKGSTVSVVSEEKSVVSVVRCLILIVVKVKQCSERSQRFPFNSSEERQRSERNQ